jgi:hypothetical protein
MPSYKNWYNWEWLQGGDRPSNHLDVWWFKPQVDTIASISFLEAMQDALLKLADKGLPLYIMYSGGLDSEVILLEALKLGLDIRPVVIRFANDLNAHDVYYAEQFSQKFNIDLIYLDIDIQAWNQDTSEFGYLGLVQKYGFVHPAAPLNFWARDQLHALVGECLCITGTGDLPLLRLPDPQNIFDVEWYFCFTIDSQYKRLHWYQEHYPQDAPMFFIYTPELVCSFLQEREMADCVKNPYKLSVSSSKKALYSRLWPELETRPKFTGFEKLETSTVTNLKAAREFINPITVYTTIKYDDFIKLLRS